MHRNGSSAAAAITRNKVTQHFVAYFSGHAQPSRLETGNGKQETGGNTDACSALILVESRVKEREWKRVGKRENV